MGQDPNGDRNGDLDGDIDGDLDGDLDASITIFVPRENQFPQNLFFNRNRPQNRPVVEIVVLMNREVAIAKFTQHFGVDPFQFCDAESILELDRDEFFSACSVEQYARGQNNYVIGM